MIHEVKLEGKRKITAIGLCLALSIVLFAKEYVENRRENPPKDISEIRVGQHISWRETVMDCTLTVYNIQSVVPPTPGDRVLVETERVCGSLLCKPNTPLVKESQRDSYTCYSMKDIKTRL